jgi:hypothetical protein
MRKSPNRDIRSCLYSELADVCQSADFRATDSERPYGAAVVSFSFRPVCCGNSGWLIPLVEPVISLTAVCRVRWRIVHIPALDSLLRFRKLADVWRYTVQHDAVTIGYGNADALRQVCGCTVESRLCVGLWWDEHDLTKELCRSTEWRIAA